MGLSILQILFAQIVEDQDIYQTIDGPAVQRNNAPASSNGTLYYIFYGVTL